LTARRFPPPWSVEDIGAAFVVKDSAGQQLAFISRMSRGEDRRNIRPWVGLREQMEDRHA